MTSKEVKIIRQGRLSYLKPYPDSLKEELTFSVSNANFTKRGDIRFEDETRKEYEEDDDGWLIIPSGFLNRVINHLKEVDYAEKDINYKNRTEVNFKKPNLKNTNSLRKWQKEALSRIFSANEGVIWTFTATGKTFLIKEIVNSAPKDARIIITATITQVLKSIYKDLKAKYKGEIAGLGSVGYENDPKRITICTMKSFRKAEPEKADFVLADEVHKMGSPKRSEWLLSADKARMFGFSASAKGRKDMKDPIIESIFGPVIYKLSHKEAKKRGLISDVKVYLYKISGPEIDRKTYTARQRQGIVRNKIRNASVAKVAKHFSDKKQIILCKDNLEHLFRMKRYLPDWTLVYGSGSMTKKRWNQLDRWDLIPKDSRPLWDGEEFKLNEDFKKNKITKVICTSVWSTGVDLPNLEMLIRADGMPGKHEAIQIPGRLSRKTKKKTEGVLVDFTDNFGRNLRGRSERRVREYKRIGYKVIEKELP